MDDQFKSTEDFASAESYEEAIRAAEERLSAANAPDGDPSDRPRAWKAKLDAEAAKRRWQKQAEQAEISAKPFPIDALGPILADAVRAIECRTMAPIELSVSAVLAAVSLGAQGVGNVVLRGGKVVPLSLFLLPIAVTTERKSSVDGYAMAPVLEYERQLAEVHAKLKPQYDIDVKVWRSQQNRILSSKKMDGETQAMELKKLGPEPRAPLRAKKTFSNMTLEGMVKTFQTYQPALGVYSAEGGNFLSSHAFTKEKKTETLSVVNALWSGEPYTKVTVAHGEQTIANKRLAMHLMIQPHIAKEILNDNDITVSGFSGRILMCWPPTRIGTRIWKGDGGLETRMTLGAYGLRLLELFDAGEVSDKGELTLHILGLSDGAEKLGEAFYNEIERAQAPRGRYVKVTAQAGRAEEQARRIAGNLELFYCPSSKTIGEHNMAGGIAIARWYLGDALRIIEGERLADEVTDADAIIKWARGGAKCVTRNDHGGLTFSLRDMTKDGPNHLRPKGDNAERTRMRCRAALNFAINSGRMYVDGKFADAWNKGAKTGRFTFNLPAA
jgi:hypothetical protein